MPPKNRRRKKTRSDELPRIYFFGVGFACESSDEDAIRATGQTNGLVPIHAASADETNDLLLYRAEWETIGRKLGWL